jgi:hypothetical protein
MNDDIMARLRPVQRVQTPRRPDSCHARRENGIERVCYVCDLRWEIGVHATPPCEVNDPNRWLNRVEANLFFKLYRKGDIPIRVLYRVVAKRWPLPSLTTRDQQMYIGPHMSRLNAKLNPQGLRVIPGEARATYRITKNA